MSPNERQILDRFTRLREASVTDISRELRLSLDYTAQLCKNLFDAGYLEEVNKGKYGIREKEEAVFGEVHPFWIKLMKYVRENGGHLRMDIRFKDGIPVEAEEVRKKVRFDIAD